jgi:hypothetical protein
MAHHDVCEVVSFRARGLYPNLRRVLASLSEQLHPHRADSNLPADMASVVECEVLENGCTRSTELPISAADLLMLRHADQPAALHHLSLILRAQKGDEASKKELQRTAEKRFRKLQGRLERLERLDDRYLVLSSSQQQYPCETVSHKGWMLLTLSQQGYPVPDFVILTSEAYPESERLLEQHVTRAVEALGGLVGRRLGASTEPLVLAMRCAMPQYYPGLMPTYLNVGITEKALPGLESLFGRHAAEMMYLNNLKNLLIALGDEPGPVIREASERRSEDAEKLLVRCVEEASEMVRKHDPRLLDDGFHQVALLALEAYRDFERNADLLATLSRGTAQHPALVMQMMVCSVREERSYVGVLYSRNPMTGSGFELETAMGTFGEDIMTGAVETTRTDFDDPEEIREVFPSVFTFMPLVRKLEQEFQFPVTIEFAAEAGAQTELFALLQLNQTGMTGRGAFISTVDLHKAGVISRKRIMELIQPYHVKQIESDTIDSEAFKDLYRFGQGISMLPRSAITARVYFSAEEALKAKRRGESVCFCKRTFAPTDTVVMGEADAILSLTGAAIHVVTICQSFGTPALLSLERDGITLQPGPCLINAEGVEIHEGNFVTISSRRQALFKGKARFQPARFIRYLRGEELELTEAERKGFEDMAYAYRYYHKLVSTLGQERVTSLWELIRLVNLELRDKGEEARQFVRAWCDSHEQFYVDEVLRSELGDHLNQHRVFDMLTLDQKIRFFTKALDRCEREKMFGFAAGAFMLGRFISTPLPVAFWRSFGPRKTALLLNEWLLFEKYMQVLHTVGERRINRARKRILSEGLARIELSAAGVTVLVPLKLAGTSIASVRESVTKWCDPQLPKLLDLLEKPYNSFFDFKSPWGRQKLEAMCQEAGVEVPAPDDR